MDKFIELIGLNWTIVMIWINVIILFLILRKFFFEKVRSFIEARENSIKDALDTAESVNRKADEKMESYNKKIANIEAQGREIIKEAKVKADGQADEIIAEARAKAHDILAAAEIQIQREQERALRDMKQQIAELSMMAAEKIVEKDIEVTGQEQIVNEVIEQAGVSRWQN